jgi:hypothetical protein
MNAANELGANERPQPSMSIEQAHYDAAMEQLHQVDQRIPGDIAKKAVQLFFSTGLLPDYDLSTCHVRELPQTNMLALVMPLPEISRYQMPPPFGGQQSHTWALNDHPHLTTDTIGRKDQTGKLVLPQKPTEVSLTNLWGILHRQRSFQC